MKIPFRDIKVFDAVLPFLLFAVSFSYFQYGYKYFDLGTYHYDEGIVAYGALRVLGGAIPYRDFWTLYAPGEFYILAVIFKIFGISIKVTRLFAITTLALTVCSIYLLIKKLCSRTFAVLAFLLSLFWLKSYMVYNRPGQLAILLFILSCFALYNFLNSGKNKELIIMGAFVGLIGLFRQDFGLYIFTSIFLVILLKQLNYYREKEWKIKLSLILKDELYLLLGCFIIILPLLIYLTVNSAVKEFISDAVIFPITIYPKVRDLPFPELKFNSLIFYLPLFVFFLTSIRLLFYNWRVKVEDSILWLALFFLFSGLGLFNYTNVRACMTHLLPTMIPAIILFILLFYNFLKNLTRKTQHFYKSLIWVTSSLICFILFFYLTKPSFLIHAKYLSFIPEVQKVDGLININRAQGFYDDSGLAKSLASATQYIKNNTEQDEKIFVGNLRHDKVVNSDVMFYFLSERDSATKYYELHPGLTNTQKIQREIISDLIKANVRYIVLWSGSKLKTDEPNESSKSSGVLDLDDFIKKNYVPEKIFGPYIILRHL
jgi:hypothetical protein